MHACGSGWLFDNQLFSRQIAYTEIYVVKGHAIQCLPRHVKVAAIGKRSAPRIFNAPISFSVVLSMCYNCDGVSSAATSSELQYVIR